MAVNFTGQKINAVKVLCATSMRKRVYVQWKCRCDCGKVFYPVTSQLTKGIQSCGCMRDDATRRANTKHGAYKNKKESRLHRTWRSMIDRCHNKDAADYRNYGGRGIRVCRRWRNSYLDFKADVGKKPGPGYQLDREDNNGPYKKSNCRWVLPKQNCRNKRNNHPVTHKGRTMLIVEWAEESGLSKSVIANRLRCGWSMGKILRTPVRGH